MGTLKRIFITLTFGVGAISIIRTTAAQGTDFAVFWNSVQLLLNGDQLYSIARDGGMVFKYPPWIIPFLFPFGLLSLEAAKWTWGVIEVLSLAYCVRWLTIHFKLSTLSWFLVTCFFWGLWIVHALDGQISLMMLALSLYCWSEKPDLLNKLNIKLVLLVVALSTKIFTLFPLLSLKLTKNQLKTFVLIGGVLSLFSLPAVWNEPKHSPFSLVSSWSEAAHSAGKLLNPVQVRGKFNPGMPGYLLQSLKIPAQNTQADVLAALFFSALFGIFWFLLSRNFDSKTAWLGWLALTPVIHPLPWWHLFIFSFPLSVVVFDRAFKGNNWAAKILCALSIFLICFSTEKLFGAFGVFLEFNAAKSWGVLACIGALIILEKAELEKTELVKAD